MRDGKLISIWRDARILGIFNLSISPLVSLHNVSKVSGLIHPSHKIWKSNLGHSIFGVELSKVILSISISREGKADRLVWQLVQKKRADVAV